MKRPDERDTMFARASYEADSKSYNEYYKTHPELKEIDDRIRSMPKLCTQGTSTYDPLSSPMADAAFGFLDAIRQFSEGAPSKNKIDLDPSIISKRIKGLAKFYGATLVGITSSKDEHFYSHRGRHPEVFGQTVENNYSHSIAIAVKMDRDMLLRSPLLPEILVTSKTYVDVAVIGLVLCYYIRSLGYEARNNMDASYLVDCVKVGSDAGLGQRGRNGMLTHPKYGSMMRLGVINTTLPLINDEPIDFGLNDFCELCNKCESNCLSKAISTKCDFSSEKCYTQWRKIGTDCGICLTTCPFGHGLDSIENIESFKNNKEAIEASLQEFQQKFGKRPFIKEFPDWLK